MNLKHKLKQKPSGTIPQIVPTNCKFGEHIHCNCATEAVIAARVNT